MIKKTIILSVCILCASILFAQQEEKVKLKISGFVSAEAVFDTRKVVAARDGDVLLYPAPEVLDDNGKDINEDGGFSFFSIHSRLRARTTPYKLWGGLLTALVEVDFVGTTDDKISMVRMRHAMMQYKKGKNSIIAGQYWHPMFVTSCFPEISSWGAAVPVSILSRNPQIRFTREFTKYFRGSITALSQVDFKSNGPKGASSDYLRNTSIPEFDVHLEYGNPNDFVFGVVAGSKELKPRELNEKGNKVEESIRTYHALAYASLKTSKMQYKLQGIYAEDGYNMLLLGGYGVSDVDAKINEYSYESIASSTIWGEVVSHYDSPVNFGLFAGYAKNMGADKEILTDKGIYARGANIDNVLRIAPRIIWGYNNFKIMAEVNQTFASYGTPNSKMEVQDTKRVGNTRLQLHFKYSF
ncbi:hypothetical protein C7377_0452 [Balneicella halophila]|uniref:Porin n=1 Tax=Balneicella halophila TaxID=1537566 RepID=A0A7L4URM0_BALHA|nr:hypothetical protein [Balneicella halophila]PVX52152.1 hypothetical protein C7377_0452 [Balneicella halophila]